MRCKCRWDTWIYSDQFSLANRTYNSIETSIFINLNLPTIPYYYTLSITKNSSTNYAACQLGLVQGAVCKRKFNGQLIVNGSITATQIAAESITADKLKVTDLNAIGATIGGFTIGDKYIANGTSKWYDSSKTDYVYVGTDGISCGHGFTVTKSGQLVLTSTTNATETGRSVLTVQNDDYYATVFPNRVLVHKGQDNYGYLDSTGFGTAVFDSSTGAFARKTYFNASQAHVDTDLYVQKYFNARENAQIGKNLQVNGILSCYGNGLELYHNTPFIDFHYGNNGDDYTARIIEEASKTLTLIGNNGIRCATSLGNGYIMHGRDAYGHKYGVKWDGTLRFYVDSTNVGNISDRRLKKDIKPMHDAYLQAVGAVDIVQYKVDRTIYNDDINFGAIAQDLRKSFTDHGLCPDDYKLLGTMQDTMDDPTLYYTIDYEQFLIARVAYDEKRTDNLEQQLKDYQSDNAILRMQLQQLQHQLDALTVKVNAE